MQNTPFYALLWLFFSYALLGWAGESALASLRARRWVNRGLLSGPFCPIYGFAAVAVTVGLGELRDDPPFLFLGAAIVAGFLQWFAGRLLERISHRRWWDCSHRRLNIDGYVCLESAAAWGLLGVLALSFLNPLLLRLGGLLPRPILQIVLWAMMSLVVLDTVLSGGALRGALPRRGHVARYPAWARRRVAGAYPSAGKALAAEPASTVFAAGCGFYKIVLLFLIGAFLGDAVETVFCRLTEGVWMSRSSVVWGPFSLVWGLGLALGTLLLYRFRGGSVWPVFLLGAVMGGAFEYLCSVFTELAFGKVFWDYSAQRFHLGGRISLLFCIFWGIAAAVWIKLLYPRLSALIERIPMRQGKLLSWCLVAFMAVNISVSALALARGRDREAGLPAEAAWEQVMDRSYGDEVLRRVYPNAMMPQGAKALQAMVEKPPSLWYK